MIPSHYQAEIYSQVKTHNGSIAVKAVAGSGKTTTGVNAVRGLFEANLRPEKILALAFNKSIATMLESKVPASVTVKTVNAFGLSILKEKFRPQIDQYKVSNILATFLDPESKATKGLYFKLRYPIERIMGLLRSLSVHETSTLERVIEICDLYDVELPDRAGELGNLYDYLIQVWQVSINTHHLIDFDDMIYLPVHLGLVTKKFDRIMVDEVQDLSLFMADLIVGAGHNLLMFGDPQQAIYGFRGADIGAMENLTKRVNALELPLSICYRCPKSVVRLAKKIVPQIEAWDDAPEGIVDSIPYKDFANSSDRNPSSGSSSKGPEAGDFVLCRTTEPLVSSCLAMIREGRKATVKGRDIGEQLKSVILKVGKATDESTGFHERLQAWKVERIAALEQARRESLITKVQDQVDTISVLLEGTQSVGDILKKVDSIFSDAVDSAKAITHSTIHRAKGHEFPHVFVIRPDLLPHPSAKKPYQLDQEKNLEYVAYTHAQQHLTSVNGKH